MSRRLTRFAALSGPLLGSRMSSTAVPATSQAPQRSPAAACANHRRSCDSLYDTLKDRLGSATNPLPSNQIYQRLVHPSRLVDEFSFSKTTKRVARQHAAFRFLRRHNVLLHGLLFYVPLTATWNVTAEFARLSLLGESVIRAEVRARLLKLFPDISHETYTATVEELTSRAAVVTLFDALSLHQIVGARPPSRSSGASDGAGTGANVKRGRPSRAKVTLSPEEKYAMLCAVVGEMHWFAARTKATDRTHNNALFPPSDVLILHVLCTHLLECVPAELIFRKLEPMVQRVRSVWVNAPMSLPSQLHLRPRTIQALSLSAFPHRPSAEEEAMLNISGGRALAGPHRPTKAPATDFLKSHMRPRVSHRRFDSPWYDISSSDRRTEAPVLSPQPSAPPASQATDAALWNEHRRRQLAHPEAATEGPLAVNDK